ncbi:hypothetical protein R3P38DRAFT_3433879 [Favolaschia claudopus]|uniref:MYND-type domain-containing protein n=1 Tax=Favolaschia claudopus TaxID=2862362 RepID=A0AAW0D393_9AGAR
MDKRYGEEGKYGIGGGGLVSAESQRNLEIAEDLCRQGKPTDAVPYLTLAMKDRNNFDAEIQMAYLSPELSFSVEVLESAEKRARMLLKTRLGSNCFDDSGPCVGRFFDSTLLITRPYMRILQALVRFYFSTQRYDKGARTAIEILRLSPRDPLNQRWWLAPLLIRTNRPADALFFCQQWIHSQFTNIDNTNSAFRPPSGNEPLSPEMYDAGKAECAMVHNAALAAFHVWGGESALAQQLLGLAARSNPAIFARVLGRRAQPSEGKFVAHTTYNGAEEAHDYLWIAQDLWMVPEVWDWVNASPGVTSMILKCCSRPECQAQEGSATEFKRCAACQQVVYCGQSCQKADWKSHKSDCAKQVERNKIVKDVWKRKPTSAQVFVQDGGAVRLVS